eukprot:m.64662 g.64662  ORF g.64662 m.64662 type:complete len:168 (+) comp13606_c1_seq2:88-591(+)
MAASPGAGLTTRVIAERLRSLFDFFDENGDGTISVKELTNVMRTLGHNPSRGDMERLMASADLNHDGKLQFDEFYTVLTEQLKFTPDKSTSTLEIVESFRVFDVTREGWLSVEQFKHVLMNYGERLPEREADKMIAMCDVNKDGFINYEAFVAMVENVPENLSFLDL